MGGRDQKKVEEDYELFLRDLEEDPEMRGAVNLYKDVKMAAPGSGSGAGAGGKSKKKTQFAMDVDEHTGEGAKEEDEEEEEADFPGVKLDELLENFDEMTLGDSVEQEE